MVPPSQEESMEAHLGEATEWWGARRGPFHSWGGGAAFSDLCLCTHQFLPGCRARLLGLSLIKSRIAVDFQALPLQIQSDWKGIAEKRE